METYDTKLGTITLIPHGSFVATVKLNGKVVGLVKSYIACDTGNFIGWGWNGSKHNTYANAKQAAYSLIAGE